MGTSVVSRASARRGYPGSVNEEQELTVDDLVELEIGDVAHGGIFVARHSSGRVVFVSDALPGERVRARITEVRKRHARAATVEVLDASAERQEHVWPAASLDRAPEDRAGGAEFGHLLPSFGRELKRRVLADALSRFGGLGPEDRLIRELEVDALPGDDESRGTGWRTRVTLHVDDAGRVGPFAARSHRVVDIDSLPLATPAIEQLALEQVRAGGRGSGRIDFVSPADGSARMRVLLDGREPRAAESLTERVHDHEFVVSEAGFWQVHRAAATKLFDAVRDMVDPARFDPEAGNLDLYGGVGLFGVALAELGGPVTNLTSVEAVDTATELAARNLADWQYAAAVTGRVDRFLRSLRDDADGAERAALRRGTVVLDPPRSGAGKPTIEGLAEIQPAQIVYVACDPVALARDVALLRERGYRPVRMRALDLFPNTHHLETVALFTRDTD